MGWISWWVQFICEFLGFGEVQGAFVKAATEYRAFDAIVCDRTQCFDIVDVGNAPRGDDRNVDMLGKPYGGFDVDTSEHAVASDVSVDNGFATVVFEFAS